MPRIELQLAASSRLTTATAARTAAARRPSWRSAMRIVPSGSATRIQPDRIVRVPTPRTQARALARRQERSPTLAHCSTSPNATSQRLLMKQGSSTRARDNAIGPRPSRKREPPWWARQRARRATSGAPSWRRAMTRADEPPKLRTITVAALAPRAGHATTPWGQGDSARERLEGSWKYATMESLARLPRDLSRRCATPTCSAVCEPSAVAARESGLGDLPTRRRLGVCDSMSS